MHTEVLKGEGNPKLNAFLQRLVGYLDDDYFVAPFVSLTRVQTNVHL